MCSWLTQRGGYDEVKVGTYQSPPDFDVASGIDGVAGVAGVSVLLEVFSEV